MADPTDEQDYFGGLGQDLLGKHSLPPAIGTGLGAALTQGLQGSMPNLTFAPPAAGDDGATMKAGIPVQASGFSTPDISQVSGNQATQATPEPQSLANEFYQKYGPILKAGNIDLQAQIDQAKKMPFIDFVNYFRSGHPGDYKATLRDKYHDQDRLQKFGNTNFGMMAAARGVPMWEAIQGAGLYQTFGQDKSPWRGLLQGALNPIQIPGIGLPGAWTLPEGAIRYMANRGFQFGDNPGDTQEIINGYDYYRALQALQNH